MTKFFNILLLLLLHELFDILFITKFIACLFALHIQIQIMNDMPNKIKTSKPNGLRRTNKETNKKWYFSFDLSFLSCNI